MRLLLLLLRRLASAVVVVAVVVVLVARVKKRKARPLIGFCVDYDAYWNSWKIPVDAMRMRIG